MNLFQQQEQAARQRARPLAARMRPRTLDEFVGQQHFLGPGKLLRRMLQADRVSSVLFYGPPGCGKTSLAELIALHTRSHFAQLNAAAVGVKELRGELDNARTRLETTGKRTILFVDELHRFNKAQQDVLLPDVEEGIVSLVAATTHNPFFSVVSPLVSRSQIFEFKPLVADDIIALLERALTDAERGLGRYQVTADPKALRFFAEISDGDARRALNGLEIAALSVADGIRIIDLDVAQESIQKKAIQYDGTGDEHYDAASAFIKSMRGSDPDAALYWLARMLEAGEDPRFLARRIVIAASEDVGNADPQALVVAMSAAQATEFLGMPECRITLAQAVTYVSLAPKSNASYLGIDAALEDVRHKRLLPVPMSLRDTHYSGAQRLGRGAGYDYPHDHPSGWVPADYLGVERQYYEPVQRGFEAELARRLAEFRELRAATGHPPPNASAPSQPPPP